MPWDKVELSSRRACLGRLYFQVPGGIQYGQHWLNVKFAKSVVRAPFRILTKGKAVVVEATRNPQAGPGRVQEEEVNVNHRAVAA
jgi:hypothetical protein